MMKSKKLVAAILAAASITGGAVSVQAQTIEGLESKVNTYTARVSQAEDRIGVLEQTVNGMDTTGIADNKVAIQNEADARAAGDTALQNEMDTRTNNLISAIQTTAENLNNNLVDVQKNIETNLKSVEQMAQTGIDKANQKIDTNAGNIEQNRQDIAQNKIDIANNASDIVTLQHQMEASGRVEAGAIADQVDVNTADIGTIFGQMDQGSYADGTYFIGSDANGGKQMTIGESLKTLDNVLKQEMTDRATANRAQDLVINQINENMAEGFITVNETMATINQNVADGFTALSATDKALDDKLGQEIADRKGADAAQDKVIQQVNDNLVTSVNAINKNMADGFTALSNTDAQLQANIDNESAARIAGDNALNSRIDSVESDATKGIAKASALAALHPLDYDPDNKFDIAAAGGFYKGENAFALGAFYRPNRNVMLSLGTTLASGDNAYNVGVTFKIGKSGKHSEASVSTAELYEMIGAMQKRIEELEANQAK